MSLRHKFELLDGLSQADLIVLRDEISQRIDMTRVSIMENTNYSGVLTINIASVKYSSIFDLNHLSFEKVDGGLGMLILWFVNIGIGTMKMGFIATKDKFFGLQGMQIELNLMKEILETISCFADRCLDERIKLKSLESISEFRRIISE